MPTTSSTSITPITMLHLLTAVCGPGLGIPRVSVSAERLLKPRSGAARQPARILIRPRPGFYVMRLRTGAPLIVAVIFQLCPMVIPQPLTITGPHPDEWCRPSDRSRRYGAQLDGKHVDLDRVWTARSLRPVGRTEYEFRSGPLWRWARENPGAPEATPHRPVDLGAIPPLF